MAQYYYGRYWGSFDDPVAALVAAKFNKAFAEAEVRAAGDNDVFVAFDQRFGVRLVRVDAMYTRWLVRFDPLFDSEEGARSAAEQMPVLHQACALASPFLWTGEPRFRPIDPLVTGSGRSAARRGQSSPE